MTDLQDASTIFALITEFLETYEGRDKVLKSLSYLAKFATIVATSKSAEAKFKRFSSHTSECRVILSLLDDIPTLQRAIMYGWGHQESDWLIRIVELLRNLVDIIANPIGHVAWAAHQDIIDVDEEFWSIFTTVLWILSLQLSLIKSARKILCSDRLVHLSHEASTNNKYALQSINKQRRVESLRCVRLAIDLSYAVSYLPRGTLWGGCLKTWQTGLLGTISSIIGIYQSMNERICREKYS